MKLKKVSSTFNTYVVQKLKKLKIKGIKEKMPSEKIYDADLKRKETTLQTVLSTSPTAEINLKTPTLDVTTTTKLSNNMRTTENYSSPTRQQKTVPIKRSANDFRFGKSIGEGSFSTVYLAKDIHTNKEFAIKVCEKSHIIREKKQEYIKREREVMHRLINCPGFVNLFCTFQDAKSLYFVMTYAKHGDLLPYINKVGSFDMDCTRYYAAELLLALEEMHKRGIIHRDLKPENILLDEKMHILIADFGSAKLFSGDELNKQSLRKEDEATDDCGRERKRSFVGTAQYVSPEILKGTPTSRATDLWALGCIIYQMISGLPPFRAATEYLIFQKVLKLDFKFPDGFDKTAKDLVDKLIQLEPETRLGYTDVDDIYTSIRTHPFFDGIDFENLRQQRPPQIHPYLPGVSVNGELRSQYRVPDYLEPGLDERQLTRLLGLELGTSMEPIAERQTHYPTIESTIESKNLLSIPECEIQRRLGLQKLDKWHQFVDGELILKKGLVNKRKGLFSRKRMLLLTTGPRLIYVDPVNMVKKGEIPWTPELRVEPKNFKIFFVHTPHRTYYLEDSEGFALEWCKVIDNVRKCTNKYISTEILCFSSFETNLPQVREIIENKCKNQIFIS